MSRLAIYPGSFDPPTNGHLSLIQRGLITTEDLGRKMQEVEQRKR